MKTHTKANGYFKDLCHYSKTGWAWWRYPQPGDVTTNPYCTCKPCKPPNTACSGRLEGSAEMSIDTDGDKPSKARGAKRRR